VAALAALTAADTGLLTPRALEPRGFCLATARAGELVGPDRFYVGKLKGIGPIYHLTAVVRGWGRISRSPARAPR
jgi:hypothetical protein